MTSYVKKIHIDKESNKYIILAAKNSNSPGHHVLELTHNLQIKVLKIVHKKIKILTLTDTGMSAKISKSKDSGKLIYEILKIYNRNNNK